MLFGLAERKGVTTLSSEGFGLRRQEVSGSFSSLLSVLGSVTQMQVPWKGFELFVGSWRATGPLWPSEESPSPLGTRAHGRRKVMPREEAHPDTASRAGRGRQKAPEATRGWASSRSARQVWRLLPTSRGPLRARGAGAGLPGETEPDSGALVLCVSYTESVLCVHQHKWPWAEWEPDWGLWGARLGAVGALEGCLPVVQPL